MAKYTGNILTNLGKDLLARAVIGGEVLTFTKVELGKGAITGENQEEFTELIDSFRVLPITSTAKLEGGSYRVRVAFSNSGIIEDTNLREIGVFARGEDGVEILYSYCNTDTPDLIPAEGAGVLERVEDIITYISNAANINAVIDQSKVYITIKDLNEHKHNYSEILGCPYIVGDYLYTESESNPAVRWLGTVWLKIEGRSLIGTSEAYLVGSEGGRTSVTLLASNLPSHNHSFSATSSSGGSHSHTINSHRHRVDSHAHSQPSHYHKYTNPGSGKKAIPNGSYSTGDILRPNTNTGSAGGDTTGSSAPYTDYQSPGTNSTGSHSHTISGTTGVAGSGNSFNILNPYRAVNIWRRTA